MPTINDPLINRKCCGTARLTPAKAETGAKGEEKVRTVMLFSEFHSKLITDITGLTGMRIIRAVLAGKRDPFKLAQMKNHRIKNSLKRIAKAL